MLQMDNPDELTLFRQLSYCQAAITTALRVSDDVYENRN
jgi:hypothetical protein